MITNFSIILYKYIFFYEPGNWIFSDRSLRRTLVLENTNEQ